MEKAKSKPQNPNTSHAHTARTTVWVQLVVVNATINSNWIISLLKIGFLLMGLITIRYNTYHLPPIGMASFYNSLCLFLIISFKLYIAVFITTLINMQNYRQKTISPNILILFKKKSNNSNYGDFAIIRRVPTLLPM